MSAQEEPEGHCTPQSVWTGCWVWQKEQVRQASIPDLGCLVVPQGVRAQPASQRGENDAPEPDGCKPDFVPVGVGPRATAACCQKAECRSTTQVSITHPCCLSYWQSHRGQKSKICPRRQLIPRYPPDQFILQAWHTHAAGLGILEMLANITQHIHLGCGRHAHR